MDIILTWPKKRSLDSYLEALEDADRRGERIFFRCSSLPKKDLKGSRCYMVHDGAIRGWVSIHGTVEGGDWSITDPITGAGWPEGNYIVRNTEWHPLEKPVEMKGFRGFRYASDLAFSCPYCEGKGEVYVHDPSADGHGGLNGGMWVWLQCHKCHGQRYLLLSEIA